MCEHLKYLFFLA